MSASLGKNTRLLGQLDIPGGGQIVVSEGFAYIGHMKPPFGTTIVDVCDPYRPRISARIDTPSPWSHTHKVRVSGDIMVTNVEQDRRHLYRRGERIGEVRERLRRELGHEPEDTAIAAGLGVGVDDLGDIKAALARGYREGGFRVWDISDRSAPQLLAWVRTHGFGVHRFDLDTRYAYISTEMEGYLGNILVIYDLADPSRPVEVSRWWLPGQHISGGERPHWPGYSHRLHHALRVGNELWAAVWHAGFRVIDISDITAPQTVAAYNYHPWVVEPTHTVLPLEQRLAGRRIAVVADEEHTHRHGQPHAGLWVFDITDLQAITPLATFHVSELDSPWARSPGRFGMHQFRERIDDTLIYCAWFSAGLRIVDIGDPGCPVEAGFYIPSPQGSEPSPQSNDVDVDDSGLIYLLDRNRGLDIIEYRAHA